MYSTILLVLIYIISVYSIGRYFSLAYSQKGIWLSISPKPLEFLLIICPCLNTAFALMFWITENPIRTEFSVASQQKFYGRLTKIKIDLQNITELLNKLTHRNTNSAH